MTRALLGLLGVGMALAAGTACRAAYEGHALLTSCGPAVSEPCPDPLCDCHGSHTHVGGWGPARRER